MTTLLVNIPSTIIDPQLGTFLLYMYKEAQFDYEGLFCLCLGIHIKNSALEYEVLAHMITSLNT